jgi:retrotransposon gag protein
MSLNCTLAIAQDPIQKVTYFLSFMVGNKTKGWTRMQSLWLQDTEEDLSIIPITCNTWQMVEHDFKQTFVDYTVKEKAQDKLHKLQMKEGNINQYITNFSLLAMDAQVDPNEPTVLMLFYQGLPLSREMSHM